MRPIRPIRQIRPTEYPSYASDPPLPRKPAWLKTRLPSGAATREVDELLGRLRLNTVCASARCPNLGECWGRGTATFMILGDTCTRHCRFCAVKTGNPEGILDPTEPERVAAAAEQLKLSYVVITSVDRDDLPDSGAGQFRATIAAVRRAAPSARIEVLIPDFSGRDEPLATVAQARPDLLGHNLETVEALTPEVRDPRAGYQRSLSVLRRAKSVNPQLVTKSGIMVGLGETPEQVCQALCDLRASRVDIVTIGQYLSPTRRNLPVREYVPPERFAAYESRARALGFDAVFSGPLVRSSYHAEDVAVRPASADTRRKQGDMTGSVDMTRMSDIRDRVP
jgi:lipoic acid synthetase